MARVLSRLLLCLPVQPVLARLYWSHPATSLADPPAGQFPWPKDYRDPNTAWSDGGRIIFLAIFVGLWVVFILTVHFWPTLSKSAKRCLPKSAPVASAGG